MATRYGSQKPRIDIYRDGDIDLAERTIKLLEHYGDRPFPWQRDTLYRWMAQNEDGSWANDNCGLSVARQNGKTWLLRARIIGGMIFLGENLVYTAHQGTTVDEIRRLVMRFFYDAEPEIRGLLTSEFDKDPRSYDFVELRNGGRCVFRTRTRSAGLGFTSDCLLNDECLLADTMVDGKPIQDYKVGDMVRSIDQSGNIVMRKVTRTIKKPAPQELAYIQSEYGVIISTRNHKHLTQRGWVRADEITKEDYIYVETQPGRRTMGKEKPKMQLLQKANRIPEPCPKTAIQQEGLLLLLNRVRQCRSFTRHERRTQKAQPNVERVEPFENVSHSQSDGVEATVQRRKWAWHDRVSRKTLQAVRRQMVGGIFSKNATRDTSRNENPTELQNRHSVTKREDRNRSGWELAQYLGAKSARYEKGLCFTPSRVVSATIQKRGDNERLRRSDGGNYVYCIDVEQTHNFIADGIITHNCQEMTDAQEEALRPTLSAAKLGNPQIIMVGTPPTAGSAGTVFQRARRNVLQGKTDNFAWREWSVENLTANDDVDAWYQTNPSLGYCLHLKAIQAESVTMAQDSFNKMRLGWFAGVDAQRVITDDEWNPLAVKKVVLPEEPDLCYAVKFAPDRSALTLAVGVWIGDKIHVEVVERKRMSDGISWLSKWLLERYRKCNKIIIDGAAGTQLLVEELIRSDRRISKKILTPNVREAGAAYAGFIQAIENGTLTHYDQPILNSAIRTAKRRDIGRDGMFGFAPLNPNIQCDPVDAVAFAHYGSIRFKKSAGHRTSGQRIMI